MNPPKVEDDLDQRVAAQRTLESALETVQAAFDACLAFTDRETTKSFFQMISAHVKTGNTLAKALNESPGFKRREDVASQ